MYFKRSDWSLGMSSGPGQRHDVYSQSGFLARTRAAASDCGAQGKTPGRPYTGHRTPEPKGQGSKGDLRPPSESLGLEEDCSSEHRGATTHRQSCWMSSPGRNPALGQLVLRPADQRVWCSQAAMVLKLPESKVLSRTVKGVGNKAPIIHL